MGHAALITSISYPEHFKQTPYITAIAHNAIKESPEFKDILQVDGCLDSIRHAYGLNNAAALGYPPDTDLDDVMPLLIIFDYQDDILEVSIVEVAEVMIIRHRLFRMDGFRGDGQKSSVRTSTPETLSFQANTE